MRLRAIFGVVALSMVAATATHAWQQPDGRNRNQQRGKAESRAQVIELRAPLELLELEHEAERALLLDRMKSNLNVESMSPKQLANSSELSLYFDIEYQTRQEARELERQKRLSALSTEEEFAKKAEKIRSEYDEANKRDLDNTIKRGINAAKDDLARRKSEYLRHAREIADNRLQLAAAEKRFNDAK